MFERLIQKIVARVPFEAQWSRGARWRSGRTYWDADYLVRHGFAPRTLVDVGVAYGSPYPHSHSLYDAYPDACLVLIEPLVEFETPIHDILKHRKGIHLATAVGNDCGSEVISIDSEWLERSAIPCRTSLEAGEKTYTTRIVPVTTLDWLLAEHQFQPPFGLKIDVEGWEDRVINGAGKFLEQTEFVIAEVSVAQRFNEGYAFAGFIALMETFGFSACDFLDIGRAEDATVTFIDVLFKNTRLNR